MENNELSIKFVNGKNYIGPALLEKILADRDEKIERIERITERRRRQCAAKTKEELDGILVPEEFKIGWKIRRNGDGVLHFWIYTK